MISGTTQFSAAIQKLALETLKAIKQDVIKYQPQEWAAIATAAFRSAENSLELFDKFHEQLGISVAIIPQQREGRLGFLTAQTVTGIPKENLISLDSGLGSFQLTTEINGDLEVVESEFAFLSALSSLVKEVRGQVLDQTSSPNPVSLEEAKALISIIKKRMPKISCEFARKLYDVNSRLVGIGNQNFIFAIAALAIGKATYTKR